MFSNLEPIFEFHSKLASEMFASRMEGRLVDDLGKLMKKMSAFFRMYTVYSNSYQGCISYIDLAVTKNPRLKQLLLIAQKIHNCHVFPLMRMPMNQLPRYLVLLGAIHKKLVFYDKAAIDLEDAIISIKSITDEISRRLREETKKRNVLLVQEIFQNQMELVTPTRYLIKSGDLIKVFNHKFAKISKNKKYFFVLFNDLFIYGVRSGGLGKKIKVVMSMDGLSAREVLDGTLKDHMNCFRVNSTKKSFVVIASSPEDRSDWINCINAAAEAWAEAERERNLLLERKGKDRTDLVEASLDIMAVPEAPPCPESCFIPEAPSVPLSLFVPEAPHCPLSCWMPICPACPEDCFIPPAPISPESCWVPDPPACPPLVIRAVVPTAPPRAPPVAPDAPSVRSSSSTSASPVPASQDKKLVQKKSESAEGSVSGGMEGLFSQIKSGVKLKKIDDTPKGTSEEVKASSKTKTPTSEAALSSVDIQASLHISLTRYRQFVQGDTGQKVEDDFDDDDTASDWE
jgi:hypothetical protein